MGQQYLKTNKIIQQIQTSCGNILDADHGCFTDNSHLKREAVWLNDFPLSANQQRGG